MVRAQRPGVQLPRARCTGRLQKLHDLAREAVGLQRRASPLQTPRYQFIAV
jgi:hypothetical protein